MAITPFTSHGRHHNLTEISLWQWIFYFFNEIFFPPSLHKLLPDLPVYMSNATGVLWEAGTACPSSPPFYVEYVMLFFLFFFCVMRHTFWVPCCDLRCDFCIKTMFSSSLLPVVCIIYIICVSLRIVVSNDLRCHRNKKKARRLLLALWMSEWVIVV
jgi:hypothetical protein